MKRLLCAMLRLYQWGVSPVLGTNCRFAPSCSEYMRLAIESEGPLRGLAKGIRRLARCHPWSGGA